MEFFKRLNEFHEHVKAMRMQNQELNEIKQDQVSSFGLALILIQNLKIPEAQQALNAQLQRIRTQLDDERAFVESELGSIESNFFAAEKDRVREK
jgi:hypothetical protein